MSDQQPPVSTMPAPAWYPDPASAHHVRWWDGTAWTAYVNVVQLPRPGLGRSWFTLSGWTQVGLALCAFAGAVEAGVMLSAREHASRGPAGVIIPVFEWEGYIATATSALWLLTGVLFIIWLYRAANSDQVPPQELRWKAGWAIGGWFVPIIFFFVPAMIVNDVRRSGLRRTGTAEQSGAALVSCWWAAWLVAHALSMASGLSDPFSPWGGDALFGDLTTFYTLTAGSGAVSAAAALLGMFMVGRVTAAMRPSARTDPRPHSRPS